MTTTTNQWKPLAKVDSKGNYININETTGEIVVCQRVSNALPLPSRTSVARVRYMLSKGTKLDPYFLKHFKKWENEFARNNLDQYNKLINMEF